MDWLAESLRWLLVVIGLLMAAGTLASVSSQSHWWIRGWDFPRVHIGLIAAVAGLCYAMFFFGGTPLDIAFLILCFATVAWQAWRISPYAPFARRPVEDASGDGAKITLITSNVLMENTAHDLWLERIRAADADLVLALEVDHKWFDAISVLKDDYPHTIHQVQDNYYGMALFSRLPLIGPEVRFLVQEDVPSIRTWIDSGDGHRVRIYCVHPHPPEPIRNEDSEPRDAELVVLGREIDDAGVPTIAMGDFNDVAWSRTTRLFQEVSHLMDPRRGRGLFSTFHAKYPWARFPLDHVFHTDHFRLIKIKILDYVGSDHFPVYVALNLEAGAAAAQEGPHTDAGSRAEAQEKIDRVVDDDNVRHDPQAPVQQNARKRFEARPGDT